MVDTVDVLSEVLSAIRLDGAVYINGEFTAPWCIEARYGLPDAAQLIGGANHIIFFHFLIHGQCQAKLADGSETLAVNPGDLILVMDYFGHRLGSDVSLQPLSFNDLENARPDEVTSLCHGGGGAATRFVCGYIACDRRICRPLLSCLPSLFKVPIGEDSTSAWLVNLLRVGVQESLAQRPGARSLLTKLSELLFVEAMRRYAESLPSEQKGWLAGLRDSYVGKALAMMHADIGRAWTVDTLAHEVALSRSALGERFLDLIGEPPMQYLTRWRLAIAARSLRTDTDAIARIALRCGYESEAAFNRAFKREFGAPPAKWRKSERESGAVAESAPA